MKIFKEIVELNTEDTYRLKDKKGWFACHPDNEVLLEYHPQMLTGFKLDKVGTEGWMKDDVIISVDEYMFFEVLVVEEQGEETPYL